MGCYETDAALAVNAVKNSLDTLRSANLADYAKNSTPSIASLHVEVQSPFVTDARVKTLIVCVIDILSTQTLQTLIRWIDSVLTQAFNARQ